ncbi:hypothetical protein FJZ48_02590 [Candidatus Uhrbacteria bacterium]|nr:hypothetical protein [Candidatus Uhrbacteria bacterium]
MIKLPGTHSLTNLLLGGVLVVIVIVSFAGAGVLAVMGYQKSYDQRILPGISVLGFPLGGFTEAEADSFLQIKTREATRSGFPFQLEQNTIVLPAGNIVRYSTAEMAKDAYAIGRTGARWKDSWTALRVRFVSHQVKSRVHVDIALARQGLESRLETFLPFVKNAELHVSATSSANYNAVIVPEQIGKATDVSHALATLEMQAQTGTFTTIPLPVTLTHPSITTQDIQPLVHEVPTWLAHAPFSLSIPDKTITITTSTLGGWLNVSTSTSGLVLQLDPERVDRTLGDLLNQYIRKPRNGKLEMHGEKISLFNPAVDGYMVDVPGTLSNIQSGWAKNSLTMTISIVTAKAFIEGPDAERLGIRESLGVGKSNFSGSPVNRRKNIALGAKKVHASIVAPDAEFSLLKALGTVDGANGWLKELVIKGNQTTPEYGGGLCQIGTTTFRAALASGLPITQRRNHSYRVRYYEPAGTDATIYEPAPDFRFKNDTGKWILISTEVFGDNLAFTVWGTPDGRKVEQTPPKIYNIVPPPPKKIIETLELPVGTTKCTESPHAGADAKFDYTVTYTSGEAKKVTFTSHYRPWGAVCLIGVEKLSETAQEGEKVDETGINNPN